MFLLLLLLLPWYSAGFHIALEVCTTNYGPHLLVLTWFRNLPYQSHEQPCGLLDSASDICWLDCHHPVYHVWILHQGLFGLSF